MKKEEFGQILWKKGQQKVNNIETVEENTDLEQFLSSIEYEALFYIIKRLAISSGINTESNSFMPLNSIKESRFLPKEINGENSVLFKAILINLKEIKENSKEAGLDWRVAVLKTVIHEIIHSATSQYMDIVDGKVQFFQQGYTFTKLKLFRHGSNRIWGPAYDMLNEGITEITTYLVLREYVQTTNFLGGMSAIKQKEEEKRKELKLPDNLNKDAIILDPMVSSGYKDAIKLVKILCQLISKDIGIPTTDVEHALQRGMFQKENLTDDSLNKFMTGITYPGFMDDLRDSPVKFAGIIATILKKKFDNPADEIYTLNLLD